jgi:hypothetical protein
VVEAKANVNMVGVDKAERRDAVRVWQPCLEGTSGQDHGGHTRTSRSRCFQHERYTIGQWSTYVLCIDCVQ